jgi:alkylation response protein AidB-like acyl-CoA dehydrogenase
MFIIPARHVQPTMMAFAGEEQKRKYLPPLARRKIWYQLFSNPPAVRTSQDFVRREERRRLIINGQKIWTWARTTLITAPAHAIPMSPSTRG